MLFGVGLAMRNAIVLINAGEVGVQHFLGSVKPVPLEQGVHFIDPPASIEKMSVREQAFPMDGGIESIEAQTSEQLNILKEISILEAIEERLQREQQVAAERSQSEIIPLGGGR